MTDEGHNGASRFDARWAIGLVVMLGCVAIWRWIASGAPNGGDGAQYLAHAMALLEGRSYSDTGYLHTPAMWTVGPIRYPPGLPVTLAPILAVFGPFSRAPLVLNHLFLLAFVFMVGVYFARESGPAMGWGVAGMVAAAMLLGDHANVLRSDFGFCALVWSAMVLADRPGHWSWKRFAVITLLGCGALAYRLAGAALVPAAAGLAALQRKQIGWAPLLTSVVWLGVFLLVFEYFGLVDAPLNVAPESGTGLGSAEGGLVASVERWARSNNQRFAAFQNGLSAAYLYPVPVRAANPLYHVCAFGLTLVGLWAWIRRRGPTFGLLFAVTTLLMLAVSPVSQPRYLWVLTPFLCYGFLRGLITLVTWIEAKLLKREASTRRSLALKSSFMVISLAVVTAVVRPRPTYPSETETWREVKSVLAELDTGDQIRAASNRPRKVAWFTGVPAMPIVWRDLDVFLREAEARDVSLVVLTTAVGEQPQIAGWEEWLRTYPDLFVELSKVGPVRIFELTRYTP